MDRTTTHRGDGMAWLTVWRFETPDGAREAARVLPDRPGVRRGVVTWTDADKHPTLTLHEGRTSMREVGRDYLQGIVGMGFGSSRGTAYLAGGGLELELGMDWRVADEIEDALVRGTSAVVLASEDGADVEAVRSALVGGAVVVDRELTQDESVLRT
ncbi:hypothetical protein GCM10023221_31280 [Luteimicrobium xylanilyticum]|uniref:Uncharacterized protein n=2 Tax=Luteimicrobium xylanilyticum TaxID=1133546 RepID=A0A5P9Q5E8_9MICO|nr:hypothetical protein KDY119_00067 [Luteimicrobium xylanilyticum]